MGSLFAKALAGSIVAVLILFLAGALWLRSESHLKGTVVVLDSDRQPVSGAKVLIFASTLDHQHHMLAGLTDEEGRMSVDYKANFAFAGREIVEAVSPDNCYARGVLDATEVTLVLAEQPKTVDVARRNYETFLGIFGQQIDPDAWAMGAGEAVSISWR